MANPQQREILRQGVKAWNMWRDENPVIKIDLQGASFREDDLVGANLMDKASRSRTIEEWQNGNSN